MRKVVVSMFYTLNGVMEAPNEWSGAYWGDDIAEFKRAELFASDALLLGRVTYEGFAAAWPSRTDEAGFAQRMNSLPKYVVSTTLKKADWNNSTVISQNVPQEIARLKAQPGQDILVGGSATLVRTLMQHNLVDSYQLLVYPIVVGKGKPLFGEGDDAALKLVETRAFDSGVVLLSYQPAPAA